MKIKNIKLKAFFWVLEFLILGLALHYYWEYKISSDPLMIWLLTYVGVLLFYPAFLTLDDHRIQREVEVHQAGIYYDNKVKYLCRLVLGFIIIFIIHQ